MTVKMNAAALDEAIAAAGALASRIENARLACLQAVPPGGPTLTSLSVHGITGSAPEWLREQAKDPLGVVRDLADLLSSEDGSSVTWDGSTTGTIADLKQELARRIADDLDDLDDVRSPEDLARVEAATALLMKYVDDPDVTAAVATELGPDGVAALIEQAAAMTGPYSNYPNQYATYEDSSYGEEYDRVLALQDDLATALSGAVATASRSRRLSEDYGRELVESGGPLAPAVLFDYAHRNGQVFGSDFLTSAGEALLEWEGSGEGMYWAQFNGDHPFGTADRNELRDPVVQWMESLSDNPQASQEVLLDPDRAAYLLERQSLGEETSGNAAGMVLQTATIDQALNHGSSGQNAATIATWAIEHFGGDAKAQDGVNEELGGIVATYIRDVDRIAFNRSSAEGTGTYGPGGLPPGTNFPGEGFPPHGIMLNRDSLTNLLGDIGGNDQAVSVIGGAATRLNEVRLQHGIDEVIGSGVDLSGAVGVDNPVFAATRSNAGLQGFLYDNMLEGGISDARDDVAQRRRMAQLLLLPTEFVKVPGGPVGSYVVGEVKSQLTTAFVGNGVSDSISGANDMFDDIQTHSQLQALHTLATSDAGLPVGDLHDTWPVDEHGRPKPIDELTNAEQTAIINMANGGGDGYASAAYSGSLDGRDQLLRQYGGS
ncbi:hypothetical protein GL325_10365 [Aeromicrobium sp. 636]|uniref:Uncharacterized protein n=1 Tax=Aeromicrobium senzhongii TaxID=2663859 RepID=A0A8I0EX69_9ACTN|nr:MULTISPECIES: hypothetical protein [Aeromicrobium]MBC9226730.1 hypothetical protein [Aeromicrobium senzhongii]MCQ3998830.1 hypothetical protein [Aeromicrobium sp. 636]